MVFSANEFVARAQLDHATLDVWIAEQWLIPAGAAPDYAFHEADLARAQLIRDLMADLGVNAEGVGVILNLVDQVHGLRNLLTELAAQRPNTP